MEVAEAVPLDAALRLRFQTDRGAIEAEAVVVWAAGPAGGRGPMLRGVAFTRMTTDQRQTLRALLQTQTKTRHTGARFSADLPVAYQRLNQTGPPRWGWMENVSRGGMLLNLHELLHPGTSLKVTWRIASEHLTVEGTIVWVEPREGRTPIRHGFRFSAFD